MAEPWRIVTCQRHNPANSCTNIVRENLALVASHLDRADAETIIAAMNDRAALEDENAQLRAEVERLDDR